MKALFLVLFVPVLAFGQIAVNVEENPANPSHQALKASPIDIQNGSVIDARYEVAYNRTSGEEEYFDLVIRTHSYRDALKPSDDSALFTVDGLGKIFNILRWTSRYESEKIVSSIVIRLSEEELKSISYAGAVGIKIGANAFSISHIARHDMRQIIAQVGSHSDNEAGFYNSSTTEVRVFHGDRNEESLTSKL